MDEDISDLPVPSESDISDLPQPAPHETPYKLQKPITQKVHASSGDMAGLGPDENVITNYNPAQVQMADKGVDVDKGLPLGVRLSVKPAVAPDTFTRTEAIREALASHYGTKFNPRTDLRGEGNGYYSYKNPETGRWTSFKPDSTFLGDTLGEGFDALTQTAGALGFSLAGATLSGGRSIAARVASPVGATLGGVVGDVGKQALGTYAYGFTYPDGTIASNAQHNLIWNSMFELGGLGKDIVKWRIGGMPLKAAVAQELTGTLSGNAEIIARRRQIEEIAARTGKPLPITVGEITGDPLMLGLQESLRGTEKWGPALAKREAQADDTLSTFFKDVNTSAGAKDPTKPTLDKGQDTVNEMTGAMESAITSPAQTKIDAAAEQFAQATDGLPKTGPEFMRMAEDFRAYLGQIMITARTRKQAAYDNIKKLQGGKDIPIQYDDEYLKFHRDTLAKAADSSNFPANKKGIVQTLPKLEDPKQAPAGLIVGSDGKPLIQPEAPGAPMTSVNKLDQDLRFLRGQLRLKTRGMEGNLKADSNQIKDTITALEALRERTLGRTNPDLLRAYQIADATSRDFSRTYNKGLVKRLISRSVDGYYQFTDKNAVTNLVTMGGVDSTSWNQFKYLTKENPELRAMTSDLFLAHYNQEATQYGGGALVNGLPDKAAHEKWIARYGPQLKDLIGNDEYERLMAGRGNVAESLATNRAVLADTRAEFKRRTGLDPEDFSPEKSYGIVFGGQGTPSQSWAYIKALERMDKDMGTNTLDSLRETALNAHWNTALKIQNGKPTLDAEYLNRVFSDPNRAELLERVFGSRYVSDMRTLMTGLQAARGGYKSINLDTSPSLFTFIARTLWAPPLSREGRALSLLGKYRNDAYLEKLYGVITDPEKLREVANSGWRSIAWSSAGRTFLNIGLATQPDEAKKTLGPDIIDAMSKYGKYTKRKLGFNE